MRAIIFGFGAGYRDLVECKQDMDIVAIADNKCPLEGKEIVEVGDKAIELINPNEIIKYMYDKIIVSTNSSRFDILQQLTALGISKEKIEFYCPSWSLFQTIDVMEDSEKMLLKVKQKDGIQYTWRDEVDEYVGTYPIISGEYKYESPYKHQVVIDVGMNVGISTLWFANKEAVDEVYAYEPFEDIYLQAKRNLEENKDILQKIKAYNYGLGDCDKVVEGYFCVEHCTASRTHAEENTKWNSIKVKVEMKDAGTEFARYITNDGRVYVLKLNCEGAEYDIIRSLIKQDLLKYIDIMLIETHDGREAEMFEYLKRSGFVWFYQEKTCGQGFIRAIMPRKINAIGE